LDRIYLDQERLRISQHIPWLTRQETLDEEAEADQKITEPAENLVNPAAEEGHEEQEEKTAVSFEST